MVGRWWWDGGDKSYLYGGAAVDVLFGEDKLAVIVATFVRSRIQAVDTVVALQDVGRQRCCSNVWWWCLFFFF